MNGLVLCSVEQLQEDMDGLVDMLNAQRNPDLPPLDSTLGWEQKGPLAKDSTSITDTNGGAQEQSRHLQKFMECGATCFNLARTYYRGDFELLGYPTDSDSLPKATTT